MKCILCGAVDRFERRYEKSGYAIVICSACNLCQLDPQPTPEQLAAVYTEAYFASSVDGVGYGDYAAQEQEYLETFAEDVRRISSFVPEGSVLDVGCGYGYFLRKAAEAGYACYGLDLAEKAVEVARRYFPSNRIFLGTLDTVAELRDRRFDIIFGSHLIEHIPDPRAFVADLATRLTENGILVFVTPNVESLLSRVSGSRWVSYKIPEHVACYSPGTITRLLESAALTPLAVDSAYQHYRLPFVASKLRHLIRPMDRLIPPIEHSRLLRDRIIRITSGSLRAIARAPRP